MPVDPETVKGFLDPVEGQALFDHARSVAHRAPGLEVGSYCGKSTLWLGEAYRDSGNVLYAVDHHRGSEEHQPGEEYHDESLFDPQSGLMDSFREFRRTLRSANLEQTVVPIVSPTSVASTNWQTPLSMVFIDGGHSLEAALTDYRCWSPKIHPGGVLAIHDLFPDPSEGGQAPYDIWKLALASGLYEDLGTVKTLGLLKRIS